MVAQPMEVKVKMVAGRKEGRKDIGKAKKPLNILIKINQAER